MGRSQCLFSIMAIWNSCTHGASNNNWYNCTALDDLLLLLQLFPRQINSDCNPNWHFHPSQIRAGRKIVIAPRKYNAHNSNCNQCVNRSGSTTLIPTGSKGQLRPPMGRLPRLLENWLYRVDGSRLMPLQG